MLRAFKLFSKTLGLKVNVHKSPMYTFGMPESDFTRIDEPSGFSQQALPLRYLGVPICAKKISAAQCEAFIDNMIWRLRVWSSRNMSCTGRTLLINSVFLSLHTTSHKYLCYQGKFSLKLIKPVEHFYGEVMLIVVRQVHWLGRDCVHIKVHEV